jgi:predicted Zn-dependent protease
LSFQSSGTQPELWGLAGAFAQEPELVLACLQGIERKPPDFARRILRAVQLALTEKPHYADLHCYGAHVALAAGEPETAAKLLEQALTINPTYAAALVLAGRVALVRRRPQEARARLENALSHGANFPDVHMLMAQVCTEQQDWAGARAAYERVLALNGNLTPARDALAALPATPPDGRSHELSA